MTHTTSKLGSLLAVSLLLACKGPQVPAPHSPTNDHQPPSTSPGDGSVLGADDVSPAQKLQEGPTVGSEGVNPAVTPPTEPPK